MEVELNELLADLQSLNQSLHDPSLRDSLHKVIVLFDSHIVEFCMSHPIADQFLLQIMVHYSERINPHLLHQNEVELIF